MAMSGRVRESRSRLPRWYSGPVGGRARVIRRRRSPVPARQPAVRREPATRRRCAPSIAPSRPTTSRLAMQARKGKIRTALRVAEFGLARQEAEKLTGSAAPDADALTLLRRRAVVERPVRRGRPRLRARAQHRPELPARPLRHGASRSPRAAGCRRRSTRRWRPRRPRRVTAKSTPPIGDIYERLNRFDEAVGRLHQLHQPAAQQGSQRQGGLGPRAGRVPRRVQGLDADRHRRGGPAQPAHAAVQAGEGQDRRAGPGQRRPPAGLRARHRLGGDGAVARDRAARTRPADYLHAQRRRRRGRACAACSWRA